MRATPCDAVRRDRMKSNSNANSLFRVRFTYAVRTLFHFTIARTHQCVHVGSIASSRSQARDCKRLQRITSNRSQAIANVRHSKSPDQRDGNSNHEHDGKSSSNSNDDDHGHCHGHSHCLFPARPRRLILPRSTLPQSSPAPPRAQRSRSLTLVSTDATATKP